MDVFGGARLPLECRDGDDAAGTDDGKGLSRPPDLPCVRQRSGRVDPRENVRATQAVLRLLAI